MQVNFWERMRLNIPYMAMEVNAQRERYRILRANVQTIVRMYNKVTSQLLFVSTHIHKESCACNHASNTLLPPDFPDWSDQLDVCMQPVYTTVLPQFNVNQLQTPSSQSDKSLLQVLTALDKEERRLFHDRLRYLDKRITPGVTKLAWTSPRATLDFFYKEACTYARHHTAVLLLCRSNA